MKRGEVWWANLPLPAGRRPVVLLSRDRAYSVRTAVTVAAVTRTIRGIPTEVRLGAAEGLPRECVVNLDDILTIPKNLLGSRIIPLSRAKMKEVEAAIKFALDIAD